MLVSAQPSSAVANQMSETASPPMMQSSSQAECQVVPESVLRQIPHELLPPKTPTPAVVTVRAPADPENGIEPFSVGSVPERSLHVRPRSAEVQSDFTQLPVQHGTAQRIHTWTPSMLRML